LAGDNVAGGVFCYKASLLRRQSNAAFGGMAYILDASIEVLRLVIKKGRYRPFKMKIA
jgi:hypothetical protein